MRIFRVDRKDDESGVSGTGHVIDGVEFDDGTVVIRWRTDMASIAIYKNFAEFKAIHIDSHPQNETIVKIIVIDTTILKDEKFVTCPRCRYAILRKDMRLLGNRCPKCGYCIGCTSD